MPPVDRRPLMFILLLSSLLAGSTGAEAAASWRHVLGERLQQLDAASPGALGVYVEDLDSGEWVGLHAEETWYLASGVKVLVAIAVLRAVDAGEFSLPSEIMLLDTDYVDGPGQTNRHAAGSELRIDFLLEQMLIDSDNTASDVLIRTVGLERVNQVAKELMGEEVPPITSLADVRRHAYSEFHGNAFRLTARDLLELKKSPPNAARVNRLAQLIGVSPQDLQRKDLDSAFDAYYATNLNAATLQAYGRMLGVLARGDALSPRSTALLLDIMTRTRTGPRRLRRGLPPTVHLAHKTGTQHRRVCDFGVARPKQGSSAGVVIASCSRGHASLAQGERLLRGVAEAVAASGLLSTARTTH
jgi:beta-lactamase class A